MVTVMYSHSLIKEYIQWLIILCFQFFTTVTVNLLASRCVLPCFNTNRCDNFLLCTSLQRYGSAEDNCQGWCLIINDLRPSRFAVTIGKGMLTKFTRSEQCIRSLSATIVCLGLLLWLAQAIRLWVKISKIAIHRNHQFCSSSGWVNFFA